MSQKPLLLTVDRNRRNLELLAQFLGKEGYQSLGATTLEELLRFIRSLLGE
jgi:CheY-like chemotaxis protein